MTEHQGKTIPAGKGRVNRECPLWLHPNGQWCKKIKGKPYYFGTDRREAEKEYWRTVSAITMELQDPEEAALHRTLGQISNEYLEHLAALMNVGKIKERTYRDAKWHLDKVVTHFGASRRMVEIKTYDLQRYADSLCLGRGGHAVNHRVAAIKAMYHWAHAAERIFITPRLEALEKITMRRREDLQIFTPEQIRDLLAFASTNLKAMVLLGVNCGLGCTDCAELRWRHIAKTDGRLVYPRIKTGVDRNLKYWPVTIAALQAVQQMSHLRGLPMEPDDRVFVTKQGNPYVQPCRNSRNPDNAVTKEFERLMRRAKIPKEKGTGFYSLRRTGATMIAAQTGDAFAVKAFLGHAGLAEAMHYVQQAKLRQQTDQATDLTYRHLERVLKTPAPDGPAASGQSAAGGGVPPAPQPDEIPGGGK